MDGVSIAASIIGIATAGVQVSIKLVTLATQISTASDSVSAIGNDISLTAGVLRQLGDLMTQETTVGGTSILNPEGLETTRTAAAMCERIFSEIEKEVKRASEQLRTYKKGLGKMLGEKIKLSTIEKTKWPFLQPRIDGLRADLRDAKSTLILLLQLATLALNKKMADASRSVSEHQDMIRAVVALELERPENRQSKGSRPDVFENFFMANPPGSNIPPTIEYQSDRTVDPESSRAPSECGNQTQRTQNSELQLFLLKPVVKDLHDRIELSWTVQDTNTQPLAIRQYLDNNEKDKIPSVVEMLEQLHAYEQEMVESETPKDSGRSILSLKRTTIDIRSRDMLFKSVPGLQFVVQCRVRQTLPRGEEHPVFGRPASLRPSSGERAAYLPTPCSIDQTAGVEFGRIASEGKDERISLASGSRPASTLFKMHGSFDEAKADGEEVDTDIIEIGEDDEAEAMVNDLLKQYTTLFNS